MKIKDVIEILKQEGTWVRWNRCTRDRILFGNENQEVKKIGICWVATNKVIELIWSLLVYMGKKIRAGFECVCEMVPALENGC